MAGNRVTDLTMDELRKELCLLMREEMRVLVRETVHEVLEELTEDDDADDKLKFRPEVAEQLRTFLREQPDGEAVEDILSELGLQKMR